MASESWQSANDYEVEFVGGPFDGHRQYVSIPPETLAAKVGLPVSQNVFRLFDGRSAKPNLPTTSIAVYQLSQGCGTPRYHFLGATAPAESSAER